MRCAVIPQDLPQPEDPEVIWLTPRAIALLVSLRDEPRNIWLIAYALGEHDPSPSPPATRALIDECSQLGLVELLPGTGPGREPHFPKVRLTLEGVAWLERHGMSARYQP